MLNNKVPTKNLPTPHLHASFLPTGLGAQPPVRPLRDDTVRGTRYLTLILPFGGHPGAILVLQEFIEGAHAVDSADTGTRAAVSDSVV